MWKFCNWRIKIWLSLLQSFCNIIFYGNINIIVYVNKVFIKWLYMHFCMFHLETILRFIRFLMGICVCERIYNFKKKWTVSIHWHSLNHFATNSLEQVRSFLNFGICCILISICYERDVYTHMLYVSVIFSQFFRLYQYPLEAKNWMLFHRVSTEQL